MSGPISVMIADDHAMVRTGLRLLLSSQGDISVVGECGTHDDLMNALKASGVRVDVVTLDLTMPGKTPSATIGDIVRGFPDTRVVVLTMHDDPSYARMAFAAGAHGYVVKSAADNDLVAAIRTVARGEVYSTITPDDPRHPCTRPQGADGGGALESLSEREREVLVFLARGHTNQQIADHLALSVKTVESYRSRLMSKLGLKDRAEMTRFAIDAGLR